ncbi:FAD dependent oxidoreductase [Cubamyces menziesii]|nr:FAD dependent oxidoreductase [Cubamyces menziesii]
MAALPLFLNVLAEQRAALKRPVDALPPPLSVPNPTKSFWIDSPGANPLAKEGSDGQLTADADIAIIGSGITGVSAAYHLSRLFADTGSIDKPIKIVILEARDFCANGGHLTANFFSEFAAYSALFGVEDAKRAIALEQRTVAKSQSSILVAGGRTHLLFTEHEIAEVQVDYEAARAAGLDVGDVEFLTKEQVEKEYGARYPGVRTPGYNIWPLKLVTHLHKLTEETGKNSATSSLHLHTNTPVTAISSIAFGCSSLPSYVLHATNAYASHLLPQLRGPSGIIPTRGQIIATRAAVSDSALTNSAFIGKEGFEFWFPRPLEPGRTQPLVILGGGRESTKPEFELYEADDSTVNLKVGETLRKFLPAVFPGRYEGGNEPEVEWSGIMGYTKTGDPFVGPVIDPANPDAYKGQYISADFAGHGMPRTFSCAEAVAQMILADLQGKEWIIPEWLPHYHRTQNRPNE